MGEGLSPRVNLRRSRPLFFHLGIISASLSSQDFYKNVQETLYRRAIASIFSTRLYSQVKVFESTSISQLSTECFNTYLTRGERTFVSVNFSLRGIYFYGHRMRPGLSRTRGMREYFPGAWKNNRTSRKRKPQ